MSCYQSNPVSFPLYHLISESTKPIQIILHYCTRHNVDAETIENACLNHHLKHKLSNIHWRKSFNGNHFALSWKPCILPFHIYIGHLFDFFYIIVKIILLIQKSFTMLVSTSCQPCSDWITHEIVLNIECNSIIFSVPEIANVQCSVPNFKNDSLQCCTSTNFCGNSSKWQSFRHEMNSYQQSPIRTLQLISATWRTWWSKQVTGLFHISIQISNPKILLVNK